MIETRDLVVHPVGAETGDHHRLRHTDAGRVRELPVQDCAAGELDQALRTVVGQGETDVCPGTRADDNLQLSDSDAEPARRLPISARADARTSRGLWKRPSSQA